MIHGFYMDESGNTGFGDMNSQPVLVYSGILVPNDKHVYLNEQFKVILDEVLNKIKSKVTGIPAKEYNNIPFFNKFEIHARDFIEGESFYSKIPPAERFEILKKILELIKSQNITIFASITNKHVYKTNTNDTKHHKMHEMAYKELLNLVNEKISADNHFGFVISDNCRDDELEMFKKSLQNQDQGHSIYPDLQIQESHKCNLVQISDLVAFILATHFRTAYGFTPRKNHNQSILNLHNQHLLGQYSSWEYE